MDGTWLTRAEALERLVAACDRALGRVLDPDLPRAVDAELVDHIGAIRGRSLAELADHVARTNAIFREANDEIAGAAERLRLERAPFLCECAAIRCTAMVSLTLGEYYDVRADLRWFLTAPEHELESGPHAHVVDDHGAYMIIENIGIAGDVSVALPRAPHYQP